jgi:hypothetical protein
VWGIGGLSYVALLERDKKEGQDLYGYSARDTYFRSNVGAGGLSHTILLKKNDYLKTNIGISGNYNHIMADRIDTSFKTPGNIKPEYRQTTNNTRIAFNTTYSRKFNSRNFVNTGIYADVFQTLFVDSNDYLFKENSFRSAPQLQRFKFTDQGVCAMAASYQRRPDVQCLGISNQYFVLNGSNALEPRAGLRYSISQKRSVSLGGGMHSQLQPFYIYFATDSSETNERVETNTGLDFTRAAHAILAYDQNFSANFQVKSRNLLSVYL